MRINSIQNNNSRGDIVVVNRKPSFTAVATKPSLLPQSVIDHFGLNMKTRVGHIGPDSYKQPPLDYKNGLGAVLRKMEINWDTHIDPNKTRRRFE